MQLAQVNIARMKAPLDDPMMKEFFDFLGPINQLAEDSPGFIWRLKDEEGTSAVNLELPFDDQLLLLNMSVWEDFESLRMFTYKTVHSYFVKSNTDIYPEVKAVNTSGHHLKTDGQRLAEALGVKAELIHKIPNSDRKDVASAISRAS